MCPYRHKIFFFCIANLPLNVTQTREKQQQRMKYVKKEGEAHFEQVKPSCHLLPVKRLEEFLFSADDFTSIITNLQTIEILRNAQKTHDTSSFIINEPPSIKIIHHLFVVCLLIIFPNISFSPLPRKKKKKIWHEWQQYDSHLSSFIAINLPDITQNTPLITGLYLMPMSSTLIQSNNLMTSNNYLPRT